MRTIARVLTSGLFAASLAACGGSSPNAPPPPAVNLVEITSANAPQIAGAVLKATYNGGDLGAFADLSAGPGAAATKSARIYEKLGAVQLSHTKPLLTESQIGTFQAPIAATEEACAVAGSTIVTGDIANPQTLSVNDVISIEFVECDDGFSVVNGILSMTIRAFSGDFVGGSIAFEVDVELSGFSVTEDGMTSTAEGSISLGMEIPSSGPITLSISSDSLVLSDGASTESLANFSFVQTIDVVSGTYSLTVSGQVDSSAFDGAVNFSTTVALAGSGDALAVSGQLVITGDANATITLVVLDAQLIRLNIDLDGDGTVDEVVDTSWQELL